MTLARFFNGGDSWRAVTRLGWLIDPQNRRVEIYRSTKGVEVLENPTELSGEAVLPNFILNLNKIWY
ncbi:hypothetical protein AsFPU1_1507 [Aphanothece sacrum FPU1]|uniref:Putative restriction endonuclease domain-containing protein n=1 Tax=Aphanothece sacrum FPU1 TaxID=1920663 RepID=A0A401IFV9_APHSA|nr:hypothetical protein AsFPU1_1507 [Aphanothece sacrum FPU1]GBF86056.1 hypothetical protein AsFPU3_3126 [Aphanothece sacrum FPU3]